MDSITIKGMSFYGYHGVMPEENRLGQSFIIDVTVYLDLEKAGREDNLDATVDYSRIYTLCHDIVEGKPVQLIERLAYQINEAVLAEWSTVSRIVTTVHKPGAPVGGVFADASVTLEKARK
jgi:dihydroneopterin aldolase